MIQFKFAAMIAGAVLFAAPAIAQTDAPAPKPVKEKKICRREAQTGSILGTPSVCHTKAEWAKIDDANGKSADDAMNRSRSLQNGSGLGSGGSR